MKKRVVHSLLLLMATCGLSEYCYLTSYEPTQMVVESDDGISTVMEITKQQPTVESAAVSIVKSNQYDESGKSEDEYIEILSQPLVFPDCYYDPNSETYREEEFWDDMELVALVCVAEAEGESEYGKRLVIDTIFNRLDSEYFPNDIKEIVYAPGQWECVSNGRINRVETSEYICSLVVEEFNNRTNSDVVYFRTDYFFSFGTPILREGRHCFSGR